LRNAQHWRSATDSAIRIAKDADSLGDSDRCLVWYAKSVRLGAKSQDASKHAWALELSGDALQKAERPKDALPRYRKAIAVLESSDEGDPERIGRILREILLCEQDLDRLDAAVRTGVAALEVLKGGECWLDAAEIADDLARIALSRGDEPGRSEWHRQTLELARRTECAGEVALAHEWIADSLRVHDRPADAIPSYRESLRSLESWPEATPSRVARVYGSLARSQATLLDFDSAKESAVAALQAHAESGEPEEAVDLVERLDPAFLAHPASDAVKTEVRRLARLSEDPELVRRADAIASKPT
jgi:tetratricopeptide (TPR) repeat protein